MTTFQIECIIQWKFPVVSDTEKSAKNTAIDMIKKDLEQISRSGIENNVVIWPKPTKMV